MYIVDRLFDTDELDPIDIVETLATHYDWDFDRITDDKIAVSIEGRWRTYAVTLAWTEVDETLKIASSFYMKPPRDKLSNLNEALNIANNKCWTGAFVFLPKQNLMIFRYAINLIGGACASAAQIDSMLENAILACERFYPAFQLTCWGEETPEQSMSIAFDQTYGQA